MGARKKSRPNSSPSDAKEKNSQRRDSIPHLIEQMAHLGFQKNLQLDRKSIHFSLIHQITQFLRQKGYPVEIEYVVPYYRLPRQKSRKSKSNTGRWSRGKLDIMASKGSHRIAIKFDTTTHLRWKSVEKLFHEPANYVVGMILGSWEEAVEAFRSNVRRIKTVAREVQQILSNDLPPREFWLILLKSKYIQQINY